jgi:hypothetical protein
MSNNYQDILDKLNKNFSQFTETDNRIEPKIKWQIGDVLVCVNANFIKDEPTHGPKDGITEGNLYEIISFRDEDMLNVKNDFLEEVPYFNWRFDKFDNYYLVTI